MIEKLAQRTVVARSERSLGLIFWFVIRSIIHADRNQRKAQGVIERGTRQVRIAPDTIVSGHLLLASLAGLNFFASPCVLPLIAGHRPLVI